MATTKHYLEDYIIRAHYEYLLAIGATPQLIVRLEDIKGVDMAEFARDGWVVLNVGPDQCPEFLIGNRTVEMKLAIRGRKEIVVANISAGVIIQARGLDYHFWIEYPPVTDSLAVANDPDGNPEPPEKHKPASRTNPFTVIEGGLK